MNDHNCYLCNKCGLPIEHHLKDIVDGGCTVVNPNSKLLMTYDPKLTEQKRNTIKTIKRIKRFFSSLYYSLTWRHRGTWLYNNFDKWMKGEIKGMQEKKKECKRFVFSSIGFKGNEPLPVNYEETGKLCANCGKSYMRHLIGRTITTTTFQITPATKPKEPEHNG